MVRQLVDDVRDAGNHEVQWNGRNEFQQEMGSGTYFYRLQTGSATLTHKMLLVR